MRNSDYIFFGTIIIVFCILMTSALTGLFDLPKLFTIYWLLPLLGVGLCKHLPIFPRFHKWLNNK
jgi:hypothetical protein